MNPLTQLLALMAVIEQEILRVEQLCRQNPCWHQQKHFRQQRILRFLNHHLNNN